MIEKSWLGMAPGNVVGQTERLLAEVVEMRQGQVIYPAQENILNALVTTPPERVRVVVLGQDPYHEPGQAMGLSFSVPAGQKLPPSLRNIYKELTADLGCEMPTSGDLTSWARQGVLLLNTVLTVREHEANSHAKLGWSVLTDWVIETCFELPQPVVFLAWGRPAINMIEGARAAAVAQGGEAVVANKVILRSTHPSPLSANRGSAALPAFMGSHPFSQVNDALVRLGSEPVDWLEGLSLPDAGEPRLF